MKMLGIILNSLLGLFKLACRVESWLRRVLATPRKSLQEKEKQHETADHPCSVESSDKTE